MDLSAAMQHNSESSGGEIAVFAFGLGDIKLLRTALSSFCYCYVAKGGFLYLRHAGTANYDETLYYSSQLSKDDSWRDGAKLFNDLRWLNSRAFTFDIHHRLAENIAAIHKKNNRHFGEIVSLCSSDIEFGIHRMFQSTWEGDGQPLSTVRDIESAVDFLKIDRKLLDRIIAEVDKIESSQS